MQPPDVVPSLGPPEAPPRNSESAVFSLVLGLLSFFFCLGPFAAVPAVVLGILGNREVARSKGRVGGSALSAAGIALGVFNLFACAAAFVAFFARATSLPSPPVIASPTPTMVSPFAPPVAGPRASSGPGEEGDGRMTRMEEVVETQAGRVTVVDVPPVRSFLAELQNQRQKAKAAHQKLVLFTVTQSCRPCMSVAAVMLDPKMQSALADVRLVRVDIHETAENELEDLGVQTNQIPGFYLLGPTLHATDGVTGAEWDDDTPDNAAPVLGAFVRGTYKSRKQPFSPPATHGTPRPPPTML